MTRHRRNIIAAGVGVTTIVVGLVMDEYKRWLMDQPSAAFIEYEDDEVAPVGPSQYVIYDDIWATVPRAAMDEIVVRRQAASNKPNVMQSPPTYPPWHPPQPQPHFEPCSRPF